MLKFSDREGRIKREKKGMMIPYLPSSIMAKSIPPGCWRTVAEVRHTHEEVCAVKTERARFGESTGSRQDWEFREI